VLHPLATSCQPSRKRVLACGLIFAVSTFVYPVLADDRGITKDLIFARKIAMDTIGHNMDEIETMLQTGAVDLTEGREHADTISVLLMTFPHLFPPSSNEWRAGATRDPGTDTFAAPEIWANYDAFYKMAGAAAKLAFETSRARDETTFRTAGTQLRSACDSCHAAYLKLD
jgi:cytochrome c556